MAVNKNTSKNTSATNVLPDLIIPVLAFAFTIYYLSTITHVPWIAQSSAVLVASLLFLAIFAFAIRTVLRIRAGRERIGFDHLVTDLPTQSKRAVLLAMTIAYIILIEDFGFSLMTFLFIFFAIVLLSSLANWKKALAVSGGCAVAGYIIFIYIFETRFPKGFIEKTIEALLHHGT